MRKIGAHAKKLLTFQCIEFLPIVLGRVSGHIGEFLYLRVQVLYSPFFEFCDVPILASLETEVSVEHMLEILPAVPIFLGKHLHIRLIITILIKAVHPDGQPLLKLIVIADDACWENHFDENVIVHRKGATRARVGEIGIIPGSQGTKSYIVEGLGNPDSFQSCSHGAGRLMSRTEAVRSLSLEDEVAKLEAQGIVHAIRGQKDLEEAAGAYKNIDEVMANQTDLVKIVTELAPVVIKG